MTETPPGDSEQAFLDRAVVIALGSNLPGVYPSSRELLDAALKVLDDYGLNVVRASSWWRSKAWPEGSGPDFLNGVALARTKSSPREALAVLHTIEDGFGRQRSERNGPRTLDLDLVAFGRAAICDKDFHIPHPRAAERWFVMGPLAEVAPMWRHPTIGSTAADLALHAHIGRDVSIANRRLLP